MLPGPYFTSLGLLSIYREWRTTLLTRSLVSGAIGAVGDMALCRRQVSGREAYRRQDFGTQSLQKLSAPANCDREVHCKPESCRLRIAGIEAMARKVLGDA